MTNQEILEMQKIACKVRIWTIEGVFNAKSGHPGGSLSAADMMTYLYFKEMNVDPKNPKDPDRDRFVLSKGHANPALYAVLAERGFFPVEELITLRKPGSRLQGHRIRSLRDGSPPLHRLPGVSERLVKDQLPPERRF